jgi:3,4-dihydroxy 2-butanone 4-phosphate synthase/GTP cyclohydrolase II
MARLPELMEFRKKHGLRICTIQSLIAHRRVREKLVELEQIVKMPTDYGDFDLHLYRSKLDGQHHLALVKGKIDKSKPTLVRVHSQCLTGDVFGSRRCDCGNQLHAALRQIQQMPDWGTPAICEITGSARKSFSILECVSSVF